MSNERPPAASSARPAAVAPARIGIVTVSDRASRGVYRDLGGPAIRHELDRILISPWEAVARLVPDEWAAIETALIEL